MTFHHWLSRRQTHDKDHPTIVGDELIRHIKACGAGVSKRDLLAGMRVKGGETVDRLIQSWIDLGEIESWRNEAGETMLRWAGNQDTD